MLTVFYGITGALFEIYYVLLQIMRKYALLTIFSAALLGIVPLKGGARLIKDFFITMPDSLMPMLDENARKDLVDIFQSGMKTALPNDWRGASTLLSLTDNYLQLREDSEGAVITDIVLLPTGKDTIVCVARTLRVPQPASEILFFNSQWQELKTEKFIKAPALSEFAHSAAQGSAQEIPGPVIPVEFIQVSMAAAEQDSNGITLEFSTNTSPTKIRYRWSGKKFIRQ